MITKTLELTHVGGSKQTVEVFGTIPGPNKYLSIRWGGSSFGVFEVCLRTGQLVKVNGGRIVKRYHWKARIQETCDLYSIMRSNQ